MHNMVQLRGTSTDCHHCINQDQDVIVDAHIPQDQYSLLSVPGGPVVVLDRRRKYTEHLVLVQLGWRKRGNAVESSGRLTTGNAVEGEVPSGPSTPIPQQQHTNYGSSYPLPDSTSASPPPLTASPPPQVEKAALGRNATVLRVVM
ncbi:hypothetical protein AN958_07409 [Leucoagaricus sp. SymC.cos]|nr:hypothetical protein AN958_07409 [Leucoagaricus sp. SymC.cos]